MTSRSVYCVGFDPSGKKLVSGSADKTVRIWDVTTGESIGSPLNVDGRVFSVSFSPDGEFIAAGYGYPGNAIQIFKAQTGEKFQSPLAGHTDWVTQVEFIDADTVVSSSKDGTMRR